MNRVIIITLQGNNCSVLKAWSKVIMTTKSLWAGSSSLRGLHTHSFLTHFRSTRYSHPHPAETDSSIHNKAARATLLRLSCSRSLHNFHTVLQLKRDYLCLGWFLCCLDLDYWHGYAGQKGETREGCERHFEEELGSHSNHHFCGPG